jgi:hypothetical protein
MGNEMSTEPEETSEENLERNRIEGVPEGIFGGTREKLKENRRRMNPLRIIQEIKAKPRIEGADTIVEDTCSQHFAELPVTLHARKLRWLRFAAVQAQHGDPLSLS